MDILGEARVKFGQVQNSQSWAHVGTFFALVRFFSLLRASYALLARFSIVLGVFFSSWNAPGSILEGLGGVRGGFDFLRFFCAFLQVMRKMPDMRFVL